MRVNAESHQNVSGHLLLINHRDRLWGKWHQDGSTWTDEALPQQYHLGPFSNYLGEEMRGFLSNYLDDMSGSV